MGLCLKVIAVSGFVYFYERHTPEVYLKKSRKARLPITILKLLITVGFIALVFSAEIFFIDNLLF